MQYNKFNSSSVLTNLGATFGTGGTICDCSGIYDLINDLLSEMRTKFNDMKTYVDGLISSVNTGINGLKSRLDSNEFVKNATTISSDSLSLKVVNDSLSTTGKAVKAFLGSTEVPLVSQGSGKPNYSQTVILGQIQSYTAPSNGYIYAEGATTDDEHLHISINQSPAFTFNGHISRNGACSGVMFPVSKNDVATITRSTGALGGGYNYALYFIPEK